MQSVKDKNEIEVFICSASFDVNSSVKWTEEDGALCPHILYNKNNPSLVVADTFVICSVSEMLYVV